MQASRQKRTKSCITISIKQVKVVVVVVVMSVTTIIKVCVFRDETLYVLSDVHDCWLTEQLGCLTERLLTYRKICGIGSPSELFILCRGILFSADT